MKRILLLAAVVNQLAACLTTVNPVTFKPDADAPTLPERAEGCAVEIYDENEKPARPYKTFGHIELSWSQQQLTEQGPEGAMKTLKLAVCERGGHYIVNMRALPRGFKEGMLFEGEVAYIVGADGQPLMGVSSGSATSKAGVGAGEPTPASDASPPAAPAPAAATHTAP
jgi:hypothetical protein